MRQLPVAGVGVDAGPTVFTLRGAFDEIFAEAAANHNFEAPEILVGTVNQDPGYVHVLEYEPNVLPVPDALEISLADDAGGGPGELQRPNGIMIAGLGAGLRDREERRELVPHLDRGRVRERVLGAGGLPERELQRVDQTGIELQALDLDAVGPTFEVREQGRVGPVPRGISRRGKD